MIQQLGRRALVSVLALLITMPAIAQEQELNVQEQEFKLPKDFSFLDIFRTEEGIRARKERRGQNIETRVLIVDTRESEQCFLIQKKLEDLGAKLEAFCEYDAREPYSILTLHRPITEAEMLASPEVQSSTNKIISRYVVAGAATLAFLYTLPAKTTNWSKDKKDFNNAIDNYMDNIKRGPVKDKDSWVFNYVTHPIAGAWYYTSARHAGMTPAGSLGFSFMMSTFFWEYGFEALAEVPSWQDLIITPLAGALFGEMFFGIEQHIRANGKVLWGSKKLGKAVLLLVNPVEVLAHSFNSWSGSKIIEKTEFHAGVIPLGYGRYVPGIALKVVYR